MWTNFEAKLIETYGYHAIMRWEDIAGIICALLLGHILTMLFGGYFYERTIRDRKLAGFSVVRVDNDDIGEEDKFRVNPHSTIESVDMIYNVCWVWLFGKEVATFHNLVRVKSVQIIFITLAIVLTMVGIFLSIHVTDGTGNFPK